MLRFALAALCALWLLPYAACRIYADTDLEGTWCTGSCDVITGPGFFNVLNDTFNIPKNSGKSYSFTGGKYWEQALYMHKENPQKPGCGESMLIFQHGNYSVDPDTGYMELTPFQQDGRMQLSRPCDSNQDTIQYYAQKEVMKGYDITKKIHMAQSYYTLQLYEYNGVLKPRMYLQYRPAQMFPTQALHMDVVGMGD